MKNTVGCVHCNFNFITGMEDVAVIFGQPQLLVVDLPYGDGEAEFAQQGTVYSQLKSLLGTNFLISLEIL